MAAPTHLAIYLLTSDELTPRVAAFGIECNPQSTVMDVIISTAKQAAYEFDLSPNYLRYRFIPAALPRKPTDTLRARAQEVAQTVEFSNMLEALDELPSLSWDLKNVHIVVTDDYLKDLQRTIELGTLIDPRLRSPLLTRASKVKAYRSSPPPSSTIENAKGVAAAQKGPTGIHAGRPFQNRGPPTTLFSSEIARFVGQLDHLDRIQPSPDLLYHTLKFIEHSCDFNSDDLAQRSSKIVTFFNALFGKNGQEQGQIGRSKADMLWGMHGVLVVNNEEGIGGEPKLQGALDRRHHIASAKFSHYVKHSNCPAIIIGLAGPRLTISTSILTDSLYVDHLRTFDLAVGCDAGALILEMARVFTALQSAFVDLRAHYISFNAQPSSAQSASFLFPHPIARHASVELPSLTFIGKLSRRGELLTSSHTSSEHDTARPYSIYIAKFGPSDVVVKFTRTYHEKAHRLLAEHQLAPHLHGVYPVQDGFLMVVMEKVEGPTAWALLAQQTHLSSSAHKDVEEAVRLLHEQGWVHGDLRSPNIIVPEGGKAKIIDFDSTAEDGQGHYPICINADPPRATYPQWCPGVERGGLMLKEHDIFLRDKLHTFPNHG